MDIDPEYLRRHYAGLTNTALKATKRDDLIPEAQAIFDQEFAKRGLVEKAEPPRVEPLTTVAVADEEFSHDEREEDAPPPDWIDEAFCVCAIWVRPDFKPPAPDAVEVRRVLKRHQIPSYIVVEDDVFKVMIPNRFELQATSILDFEIYNPQLESDYRTHFARCTDDELRGLDLTLLTAGLADRIVRMERAYREELASRAEV